MSAEFPNNPGGIQGTPREAEDLRTQALENKDDYEKIDIDAVLSSAANRRQQVDADLGDAKEKTEVGSTDVQPEDASNERDKNDPELTTNTPISKEEREEIYKGIREAFKGDPALEKFAELYIQNMDGAMDSGVMNKEVCISCGDKIKEFVGKNSDDRTGAFSAIATLIMYPEQIDNDPYVRKNPSLKEGAQKLVASLEAPERQMLEAILQPAVPALEEAYKEDQEMTSQEQVEQKAESVITPEDRAAAQKRVEGLATMEPAERDKEMGAIMMNTGMTVKEVDGVFSLVEPQGHLEKVMNHLMGFAMYVGTMFDRFDKAINGEEEKDEVEKNKKDSEKKKNDQDEKVKNNPDLTPKQKELEQAKNELTMLESNVTQQEELNKSYQEDIDLLKEKIKDEKVGSEMNNVYRAQLEAAQENIKTGEKTLELMLRHRDALTKKVKSLEQEPDVEDENKKGNKEDKEDDEKESRKELLDRLDRLALRTNGRVRISYSTNNPDGSISIEFSSLGSNVYYLNAEEQPPKDPMPADLIKAFEFIGAEINANKDTAIVKNIDSELMDKIEAIPLLQKRFYA